MPHQTPAARAQSEPDGALAAASEATREQEIGEVGAGDQQHRGRYTQQKPQCRRITAPHGGDSGAGRIELDAAAGDLFSPLGGDGRSFTHQEPILQRRRQTLLRLRRGEARPQPTHEVEPVQIGGVDQTELRIQMATRGDREPEAGRIGLERFAVEVR